MGNVLWHITMSLDGFIAGRDDAMDWIFRYPGPNPDVDNVLANLGAILAGRRSYEVGRKPGQSPAASRPYGGAWEGPVFVLTHKIPDEPDPSVQFLTGDIRSAVATAQEAAGDRTVVLFGATVARNCLEAGLVDEVLVHVAPVLLGAGVRLFEAELAAPIELQAAGVLRVGQLTNLRFRVRRPTPPPAG
jgi:dihydrofolate reductase